MVHHLRGGSWHFISRHVRFARYYSMRRCRSASGSGLDAPQAAGRGAGRVAVSRPRSSVRDVRTRRAPRASLLSGHGPAASASGTAFRAKERDTRERDCAMAVSQPRPPDRVDAALEKVAPLRYLKAHECARSELVVTRYYHNSLSYNSFLSYKVRFEYVFEDSDAVSPLIQR